MQNSMPTTCQHSITATWNTPRLSLSTKTSVSLSTKTLHVLLSTKTHHLSGSTKTSHVFLSIKTPSPLSVNQNKHRAHVGILPSRNESESADVGSSAMKRNANDTSCILVTPWRITWDPKTTKHFNKNSHKILDTDVRLASKQPCHSNPTPKRHIFVLHQSKTPNTAIPAFDHLTLCCSMHHTLESLWQLETPHVPSLATFAKCQNTCTITELAGRHGVSAMGNNLFSSATSPTRKLKRTMCESACSSLSLSLSLSPSL